MAMSADVAPCKRPCSSTTNEQVSSEQNILYGRMISCNHGILSISQFSLFEAAQEDYQPPVHNGCYAGDRLTLDLDQPDGAFFMEELLKAAQDVFGSYCSPQSRPEELLTQVKERVRFTPESTAGREHDDQVFKSYILKKSSFFSRR